LIEISNLVVLQTNVNNIALLKPLIENETKKHISNNIQNDHNCKLSSSKAELQKSVIDKLGSITQRPVGCYFQKVLVE